MGTRALIASSIVLAACAGPDPTIEHIASMPSPQAGYTRVAIDVVNRNRGHGQIQVQITLREVSTQHTIIAARTLTLVGHQRSQLVTDIATPPGAYSASALARYPD